MQGAHQKPCHHSLSSPGQGRGNMMKGLWIEIRTGRDHSPITVTEKTDWTWGEKESLIYHQSNQSRVMRNKMGSSYTFPPHLPLSRPQLHSCFSTSSLSGMGNGGYGQFITCCFCCSFLLSRRTPHTLPLFQCEVPLRGDSSPQTSPMWVLPMGCSSSFTAPARVLPMGCSPSGKGCSSVGPHGVTSPASKPAPAWAPLSTGPQVLAGACSSAVSPRGHSFLQVSTYSSVGSLPWGTGGYLLHRGPPWTAGVNLPHHGLHHKLQGKALCSDISSTSSPLLLHWPWCLQCCFSHVISLLSLLLSHCRFFFFPFLNMLSQRCYHRRWWAWPWPAAGPS